MYFLLTGIGKVRLKDEFCVLCISFFEGRKSYVWLWDRNGSLGIDAIDGQTSCSSYFTGCIASVDRNDLSCKWIHSRQLSDRNIRFRKTAILLYTLLCFSGSLCFARWLHRSQLSACSSCRNESDHSHHVSDTAWGSKDRELFVWIYEFVIQYVLYDVFVWECAKRDEGKRI